MNKTIKRIMSTLLVFSAFITIEPAKYINLITETAFASTTFSSSSDALLKSLDTDEGSCSFSSTKSTITAKVKSSIDQVTITAEAKDSSYEITIDGDTTETGECSKTVDLEKGRNVVKVKVKDPSGDKAAITYYMYITRGSSSSSSSSSDDVYLNDLSISGQNISFSSDQKVYNVEVPEDTTEIRIKAEPENDDDTVEIDGSTVDDSDNYRKWVSLDNGKNTIEIEVQDDNDNDRTYTLNVYRGEKAPSADVEVGEIDNYQDSIYLDELKLLDSGNNINFSRKVTNYEVNVPEDCDSIIVKAEAEDNVRVNDEEPDSNNNKRVYLQKGKNVIKVKVYNDEDSSDDDYEKRIYTITVNRGAISNTNNNANGSTVTNSNQNGNSNSASTKVNAWLRNNNGQWTYDDGLGKALTNTWFYDKNYGKWYHFGYDGSMSTGWLSDNGNTYYLNSDGSMQIGWKYMNDYWYYFNSDGSMKTGWIQGNNGKWYYLYPSGGMASNTTIDGYKLGSDGTLI